MKSRSGEEDSLARWQSLTDIGVKATTRYGGPDAEEHLKAALTLAEEAGLGDARIIDSLANLTRLYSHQHQARNAHETGARLLELQERLVGSDHPDIANTLHLLASIDPVIPSPAQTEAWHRRGLQIVERHWGTDHPEIVPALWALSLRLMFSSPEESASLLLRAIEIVERDTDHSIFPAHELPALVSCLSLMYLAGNQHEKRERSIRWELDLAAAHDDDDLRVGSLLKNLAEALAAQERLVEADEHYSEAIARHDRWYHSNSPANGDRSRSRASRSWSLEENRAQDLGTLRADQAQVKIRQRDLASGRALLQRARRDLRRALRYHDRKAASDSIIHLWLFEALADVCRRLNLLHEAVLYDERRFQIYEAMAHDKLAEFTMPCESNIRAGIRSRYRRDLFGLLPVYSLSLTRLGRRSEVPELYRRMRLICEGD